MCNTKFIGLISSFRNGDDSAFFEMEKEFKRLIKVYSKQNDDWEQEQILFFIELLKNINLDKFKKDNTISIHKYIAVCIRNKYIKISKNEQLNTHNFYDEDILKYFFVHHDNINSKIELQDILNRLSLKQKEVIVYHYVYGYSVAEIGKLLKISRVATNRLKNRGLEKLKELVGEDK